MRLKLAALLAALLSLGGIAVAAAPAALAADGASLYDYTDPSTTGCSGNAITYYSKNITNPATGAVTGIMELRYSRTCQTNWVRVNNNVAGATAEKTIVRDRQNLAQGGSVPYASDQTNDTVNGVSYGKQLYAPAGVCVQIGAVLRNPNGSVAGNTGQALITVC